MCCIEETDKCSVFASVRTVSVGNYRGSMIISASFGGHFINANGSQYHFVGLGVYDLATIEFPTSSAVSPSRTGMITIQISTRPYGESSVISGFVLKDTLYKIELFRLDDTVTAFFVNDVMTVFPYSPYKVGEFEIDNKMAVDSTLTIRDLRTGMVVSASVISKFISLYVGIPSYLLDITIGGLLGYSNHPTFFVEAQSTFNDSHPSKIYSPQAEVINPSDLWSNHLGNSWGGGTVRPKVQRLEISWSHYSLLAMVARRYLITGYFGLT